MISYNRTSSVKPNIIFIIFDALSAEHLSLYGYSKITDPFIRSLADSAYVFKPLITVSTYTPPSVMSIYSSLYPWKHKVYSFYWTPSKDIITYKNFFRYFKEKGYRLFALIQHPFVQIYSFNLEKYFDYYYFKFYPKDKFQPFLFNLSQIANSFEINIFPFVYRILYFFANHKVFNIFFPSISSYQPMPLQYVFKEAINLIKKQKNPFFLIIHIFSPHHPFLPPGVDIPDKFDTPEEQYDFLYREHPKEDSIDIEVLKMLYDENIKYLDKEFEKFVRELRNTDKYKSTILVITSDHGESFDPKWVGHKAPFYFSNELIRIPLIIKVPGMTFKYIDKNGSLIDIFPTLLDILDFEIPSWVDGVSLIDSVSEHSYIYCGFYEKDNKFSPKLEKSKICIIKDSFKFYYDFETDTFLLFNFVTDPKDKKDIAKFYTQEVKQFFTTLRKDSLK